MISTEEKLKVLETLLKSKAFSKSTTSNILLKYLIESSIENKNLNATDISIELLGSNYEHEKSEATIRVNIYHLRNKLKKYFEGEGKEDSITIEIKRGQYGVAFYRKKNNDSKYSTKQKIIGSIILMILLFIIYFLYQKLNYKDPVWDSFFRNNKETILYLDDVFGYDGPTLFSKVGWHRDYKINSTSEFYKAAKKNPKLLKDYSPGRNIYVNFLSAYSVNDLSKHFNEYNEEFKIHKFHNLSLQQLKEQNSIYLGPHRYNNAFIDFFNLKSKHIKLIEQNQSINTENKRYNKGRDLRYSSVEKKIDTIIKLQSNGREYEHVLVAKLKGDNNTSKMFFFSNHGFGATATIEYFTNKDSITSFNNKYLKNTDEFIALFYVKGKERAGIDIKQIFFDNNK